jgi:D-sedoheptulose 7-phosphate isomerase
VKQLRLAAQPEDMVLAISTSGKSPNLIYALQAARERGMMTIAFCGKDGGRLADIAEYCLTVPSFSIHRIQEVHGTLIHILWDMIHVVIGEEDVI